VTPAGSKSCIVGTTSSSILLMEPTHVIKDSRYV
jgi:hypothetical protein